MGIIPPYFAGGCPYYYRLIIQQAMWLRNCFYCFLPKETESFSFSLEFAENNPQKPVRSGKKSPKRSCFPGMI